MLVDTTLSSKRKLPSHEKGFFIMGPISRREFVRLSAGTAAVAGAAKSFVLEPAVLAANSERKIRFVSIGTGIRGCDLLRSARKLPNAECVGTSDLYDMHRKAGVEADLYVGEAMPHMSLGGGSPEDLAAVKDTMRWLDRRWRA